MRRRIIYMERATRATREKAVAASDCLHVVTQLQRDGYVVLDERQDWNFQWFSYSHRSSFSVSLLCQEVKALLEAGLNLVEALEALNASANDPAQRAAYASLLHELRKGRSLSDALANDGRFPPVLISAVRGGEHTGGLAAALGSYLAYAQRLDELKGRVITASVYPSIVLGFGILIVLFLLGYVVPRFASIYQQHGNQLTLGTAWVLAVGRAVSAYWIPMTVLAIALAGWAAARWQSGGRLAIVGSLSRLKPVRRLLDCFERARIYETLAVVLQGGFTVPHALKVAQGVCLSAEAEAGLRQVQRDVEGGQPLHAALRACAFNDEVAVRLAAAGAETGDMAAAMHHVGLRYGRDFARSVERLTRVVEPALLILVGGVIGTLVLMMYMPIFDLATSLGRP